MLKQAFLATTGLVLCVTASFARPVADTPVDANARFVAWYGGSPQGAAAAGDLRPGEESKVLYDQSASSGYSTHAVSATNFTSSSLCCFGNIAADDFTIPGRGTHKITAVYAAGVFSGPATSSWTVTFYDKLQYDRKTGITTALSKATCDSMSVSTSGGNVLVDVSACRLGTFKGGHDYAVAVQENSGGMFGTASWAWRTNRKQIRRQAFYFTYGQSGSCTTQFTPIKTCFPKKGYGPDLAFAIYGR